MDQFAELIEPFKDKMYRFALRMVGSTDEAQDVVQEVFIKLWKKRDYISEIKNLEAWCMQLTRNLSIDKLRSKHRRTEDVGEHFELKDKGRNPEELAISSDIYQQIQVMIKALPEKQKMVIQLRDIEGYSYQEIADALEIPLNQVKVNLFRARNTIKQKILKLKVHGRK